MVGDNESSSSRPVEMPSHVATLYKAKFDHLIFVKRQQWAITNYLLIVFAAIYAWDKGLGASLNEKVGLTILVTLAVVVGVGLLWKIQGVLQKTRWEAHSIEQKYFSCDEKKTCHLSMEPNPPELQRSDLFVWALVAVSVAGYILVLWSLWRVACPGVYT